MILSGAQWNFTALFLTFCPLTTEGNPRGHKIEAFLLGTFIVGHPRQPLILVVLFFPAEPHQ